VEGLHKKSW